MSEILQFDPAAHRYSVGGRHIPSVTQVLEPYMDFSRVPPDVLQRAADFGTAVHTATELDDLGDLDEESLDPALAPYLEGWRRFRSVTGFVPVAVEERLYCKIHGFAVAGTLDRVGDLKGARTLVDIKSSAGVYPSVALQTAAYAEAYRASTGLRIKHRFAVRLDDSGGFEVVEFKDRSDLSVFLSMLTVHNWRLKNGC